MKDNVSEREINLIDMFWAICLKWRQIIIWAIVFAVLAGGFSYFKSAQSAKASEQQKEPILTKDIDLEDGALERLNMYIEYKKLYQDQVNYNRESPLMQLNPNGFYKGYVSYFVDNHYTAEYPIMDKVDNVSGMIELYDAALRSEPFTKNVIELVGGEDAFDVYCLEMLKVGNRISGSTTKSSDENNIMTISIYSQNEEECKSLIDIVKSTVESSKGSVQNKFGNHELILIDDQCNYVSDNNLTDFQKENIDKTNSYLNSLNNLYDKFTDTELSYIAAYERENPIKDGDISEEESDIEIIKASISKKMVALGFIGGAAIAFLIIAVMYLFHSRIRLEDDFEEIYRIKLLGNVVKNNVGKKKIFGFIDRFITYMRHINRHYFSENEALEMAAAGIRIAVKNSDTRIVYATGSCMGDREKDIADKLSEKLKSSNIELISGRPILYDAEALEKSAEIGCVVLIEATGNSLYKEIADEIETCAHQDVRVIGAVVVS